MKKNSDSSLDDKNFAQLLSAARSFANVDVRDSSPASSQREVASSSPPMNLATVERTDDSTSAHFRPLTRHVIYHINVLGTYSFVVDAGKKSPLHTEDSLNNTQ